MTIKDKNVEYRSGLMILPKRTIVEESKLPDGYHYVEYTESRKEEIATLMNELNVDSYNGSLKTLDELLSKNRSFFKEHCICVLDDENTLVGCAYLIKDSTFSKDQCCIGFFGVKEKVQKKGIGTAMVTRLSIKFDVLKRTYPLYVKVDSYAYVAIAMLARMGFNPFMGEYGNCSEKMSVENWEVITNVLKEMSNQGVL